MSAYLPDREFPEVVSESRTVEQTSVSEASRKARRKGKLGESVDIPALTGHIDLQRTFCDLAGAD